MSHYNYLQNQSVEENNFLCKECEEKIENAFYFKSCLVNVSELRMGENKQNILSTNDGETAENTICHLCKNLEDNSSVIALTKFLKDNIMIEVFQGHLQEMVSEMKNTT